MFVSVFVRAESFRKKKKKKKKKKKDSFKIIFITSFNYTTNNVNVKG